MRETDASAALVLVRMNWETWARMSAGIDLEIVGVIVGPSLIHGGKCLLSESRLDGLYAYVPQVLYLNSRSAYDWKKCSATFKGEGEFGLKQTMS